MPRIERKELDPDIVLMQIFGRITLGYECQDVEWAVEDLIKDGKRKVVFDLTGLEYIDSTGVGIILMCCTKMRTAGGELRIAALQPRIAQLMKVTRLDQVMHFYPSAESAVENFTLAAQE